MGGRNLRKSSAGSVAQRNLICKVVLKNDPSTTPKTLFTKDVRAERNTFCLQSTNLSCLSI